MEKPQTINILSFVFVHISIQVMSFWHYLNDFGEKVLARIVNVFNKFTRHLCLTSLAKR